MFVLALIRRQRPWQRPGFARLLLAVVASIAVKSACAGAPPELRNSSRDGLNAGWLLASLSNTTGVAIPQSMPQTDTARDSTFGVVQSTSGALGVKADLRFLNYSELSSLQRPSVVLLRHGPESTGYFAVVLNARPGQVTTIGAGWMTASVMSEDEFRLRWTGHALVPRRPNAISVPCAVAVFLLGLGLPFCASSCRRFLKRLYRGGSS